MFYSSGYFKHIDCPFLVSGLCERHYCHFRHSNFVKVETFPILKNDNENNVGYLYSNNYLSSLNDTEYNPVNFINEVKPSYSPAPYLSNTKSSQSIQTETSVVNLKPSEPIIETQSNEINFTEQPKPVKCDIDSKISVKLSPDKKSKHLIQPKDKKRQFSKSSKRKDDMKEQIKIKKLEQIYHSIFDSSDESSEEDRKKNKITKSIKNNKVIPKAKPVKVNSPVKEQTKLQENDQFSEMEEALISGRFKGCRLTTAQILQFRMILAERKK